MRKSELPSQSDTVRRPVPNEASTSAKRQWRFSMAQLLTCVGVVSAVLGSVVWVLRADNTFTANDLPIPFFPNWVLGLLVAPLGLLVAPLAALILIGLVVFQLVRVRPPSIAAVIFVANFAVLILVEVSGAASGGDNESARLVLLMCLTTCGAIVESSLRQLLSQHKMTIVFMASATFSWYLFLISAFAAGSC